jgi:hypothetical protein
MSSKLAPVLLLTGALLSTGAVTAAAVPGADVADTRTRDLDLAAGRDQHPQLRLHR